MEREDIAAYCNLEARFVAFAQGRPDICAAFIVGSRARLDHPADRWSDLDVIVYTETPEFYVADSGWLDGLGTLLCAFPYRTSGGEPEWLTLFEGGWEADFVFLSISLLRQCACSGQAPQNFSRGVRVLVDRDGLGAGLMPTRFAPPPQEPPRQEEFEQMAGMFWFCALYIAKQLLRGEIWTAKVRDTDAKQALLRMIEWHEISVEQKTGQVWHAGRFLQEWASPQTRQELVHCFAGYGRAESWQALESMAALFARLSREVANARGLTVPEKLQEGVLNFLRENRSLKGAG